MATVERDEWVAAYEGVVRDTPDLATYILILDSMASVMGRIDQMSPEDRSSDWMATSLRERIDYLKDNVPGLRESWIADHLQHMTDTVLRSVNTYKTQIERDKRVAELDKRVAELEAELEATRG